jgi:hypothetical protein
VQDVTPIMYTINYVVVPSYLVTREIYSLMTREDGH